MLKKGRIPYFFSLSALFFIFSFKVFADVYVNVSVDWEGREVSEKNIRVIENFRQDFPHVPLLHFLNAAYYTKVQARAEKITELTKRALKEKDELGLHIHSWRSLVEASGVSYRTTPSWDDWGRRSHRHSHESGHSVPLWAYTKKEIQKIIRKSHEILEREGFGKAKSFRTGGWMGSKKVLEALVSEGFTLDASSVAKTFLISSQPLITKWLEEIGFGHITHTSQPYETSTAEGKILEFPNNACLADYMTAPMMLQVFQENVKLWEQHKETDVFISLGFHQETASYYLPELARALTLIENFSQKNNVPLHYTVNPHQQNL